MQKLMLLEDGPSSAQPQQPNDDDEFFDCKDEESKVNTLSKASAGADADVKPMTQIGLAVGNKEHHESDLPDKDTKDLKVQLEVQPLEIIYRAETVGDLTRFFKVKKLTDQTKIQAQAQYEKLAGQVEKITESLE